MSYKYGYYSEYFPNMDPKYDINLRQNWEKHVKETGDFHCTFKLRNTNDVLSVFPRLCVEVDEINTPIGNSNHREAFERTSSIYGVDCWGCGHNGHYTGAKCPFRRTFQFRCYRLNPNDGYKTDPNRKKDALQCLTDPCIGCKKFYKYLKEHENCNCKNKINHVCLLSHDQNERKRGLKPNEVQYLHNAKKRRREERKILKKVEEEEDTEKESAVDDDEDNSRVFDKSEDGDEDNSNISDQVNEQEYTEEGAAIDQDNEYSQNESTVDSNDNSELSEPEEEEYSEEDEDDYEDEIRNTQEQQPNQKKKPVKNLFVKHRISFKQTRERSKRYSNKVMAFYSLEY